MADGNDVAHVLDAAASGGGAELRNRVVERVGGTYVVESRVWLPGEGLRRSAEVGEAQGLEVEVSGGSARTDFDPHSGRLLVVPEGTETVRVRSRVNAKAGAGSVSLSGPEIEVGIDPAGMAPEEGDFDALGGGNCNARMIAAEGEIDFEVNVRAAVQARVLPIALDRRHLNWRHGAYYAHDPNMGLMRLRYNPTRDSTLVMKSQADRAELEQGASFFPASAANDLYFLIEFMDHGYSCFSKEPLAQEVKEVEWPPYSKKVVLATDKPLDFYDIEHPERKVFTITHQEMELYDYASLDVELLEHSISQEGVLSSRWRLTNQADEEVRVRWFALGEFGRNGRPSEGDRTLGASGSGAESYEYEFSAAVPGSILPQKVTMNAVTVTGPIMAGNSELEFAYPGRS